MAQLAGENKPATKPGLLSFFRTELKLSEPVLAVTLSCYLAGFVITNMYLGMLGVASFDILRVKYILTGFLFLVFVLAICIPIYGLDVYLKSVEPTSILGLMLSTFLYTFRTYLIIFVGVFSLGILSGVSQVHPLISPQQPSQQVVFTDWLNNRLYLAFTNVVIVTLVFMGIAFLLTFLHHLFSSSSRFKLITSLKKTFLSIRAIPKVLYKLLVIVVITAVVFGLLFSFIYSISINATGNTPDTSANTPYKWGTFFEYSFLLYAAAMILIVSKHAQNIVSKPLGELDTKRNDHPLINYWNWSHWFFGAILIIMPLYSTKIHPYLPQQIGGGSLMKVEVGTANSKLEPLLSNPASTTYLIDRTASSAILMITDGQQEPRVIEVDQSQIESITYKPMP